MKTIKSLIFLAGLTIANSVLGAEPAAESGTNAIGNLASATNVTSAVQQTSATVNASDPADPGVVATDAALVKTSDTGLRLNFRGVPLEMVLNYLSEAAGFIIVLEA